MLNVHLSYMPTSFWYYCFGLGEFPGSSVVWISSGFLVVLGGGCCKGVLIQDNMTPTGVLSKGKLQLRRKRGVTWAHWYESIPRNIPYEQTFRWSIYKTRWTKYHHLPIRLSTMKPRDPLHNPIKRYNIDSQDTIYHHICPHNVLGEPPDFPSPHLNVYANQRRYHQLLLVLGSQFLLYLEHKPVFLPLVAHE